jgi:hypothetical protein
MKTLVPPEPPLLVALGDDDGSQRLRLRLHQITWTSVTVLATAWCITLGTVPAVLSLAVAKHILVAILVMGLGVDAPGERSASR